MGWIYLFFALTGSASFLILSLRAFPLVQNLTKAQRRMVLNRMLVTAVMSAFGGAGLIALLLDLNGAASLLMASFLALIFGRITFALLNGLVRQRLAEAENEAQDVVSN